MRKLRIIGIGAGDPDHVTIQAIKALEQTDVFFFPHKGKDHDDLLGLRREICERYLDHGRYRIVEIADPVRRVRGHYEGSIDRWRHQRSMLWEPVLGTELASGQTGAFLAWGEPALYDGTMQVLEMIRHRAMPDLELEMIPGISAPQALAARHRISLNQTGEPILITTGRELLRRWPGAPTNVVVMLDPHGAFQNLDEPSAMIYWGAYLGTPAEILVSGTIGECGPEIKRIRASAREHRGWIFDTYLLRRTV